MLLGCNAWATNYLRGSWYGDWNGIEIADNSDVPVFLAANTEYTFEIANNQTSSGTWKRVNTTSKYTATSSKTLSEWDGVCTLQTTVAGNYVFKITDWDSGNPILSITYPAGTSYTVAFTNPNNWENVYAYVWFYDTEDRKAFGGYPGKKLTAPYTVTVEAETAPSWIIWSDGTTEAKTGDLDFVANQVYNMTGEVSVDVTPDGYATFYAPCKVQVPSGVTAYTGAYNAVASTLTLNELTGNSNIIANTPVVLKRTSGSGSITFTAVTEDAGSVSGTNNLHGTAAEITTPANSYVLGYQESTTAFYHFTGANIAANKAYLVIDGGAALAAGIRIIEGENGATGIEAIEASEKAVKFIENGKLLIKKNGVVYDTTGRVVR